MTLFGRMDLLTGRLLLQPTDTALRFVFMINYNEEEVRIVFRRYKKERTIISPNVIIICKKSRLNHSK